MKSRSIHITALATLFVIVFSFIHSELDQLSALEDEHNTHDYCELVENTALQLTKTSNELIKLKIDKSISLQSDDLIAIIVNVSNKFELTQFYTPQKTSDIYIYKNSFLI